MGAVAQTTGRLPTATGEKGYFRACDKFALFPSADVILFPEIVDITLVILQFCLNVAQQRLCVVLTLADQHHYIYFAVFLSH